MAKKIQLAGNILRKIVPPNLLSIELEKTKQASRVGEQTGLFYVPHIKGFNEKENTIDYEYLNGLCTVQELAVGNSSRLIEIFTRIGAALAAVHSHLVLPPQMKKELPGRWILSPKDNVFIHGDFTGKNVCFHEATNRIVILDWATAPFLEAQCTFGSRYFDITWFIYFVFHYLPATAVTRWRSKDMADAFVKGYMEQQQTPLELCIFQQSLLDMGKLKRKKFWFGRRGSSWYKRIGYLSLWPWKSYKYWRYKPIL